MCFMLYMHKMHILNIKHMYMYSRGQKKRDTRCYSDTYHRREMKLVPFFIEKCPL